MADIDRYRAEDRRVVDALYRRVFGHDAAEASRLRWDWQYLRNPNNPRGEPEIWIAREGPAIVGQYATMPVQVTVTGQQVRGSWGMDVMVAPERQRQGLGEILFRTWDRNVGASLGLGLSESSYRLFNKLRWPDVGPLPCLVKPLTRRAFRIPTWPVSVNRIVSAVTLPIVKIVARTRPLGAEVRLIQRFDDSFTQLWDSLANKFDFAVMKNRAGKYATPGLRGINASLSQLPKKVTSLNQLKIVDPPRSAGPLAYPIVTFTYVIAPTQSSKAADLRKFIYWAVTQGQRFGPPLLFQPLPKTVQAFAYREIKKIQSSS